MLDLKMMRMKLHEFVCRPDNGRKRFTFCVIIEEK